MVVKTDGICIRGGTFSGPKIVPSYNVAFSGSGLLFPIHIGAWKALRDAQDIVMLKSVSGTSGGSIIAALVAQMYDPERMAKLLELFDIGSMIKYNVRAIKQFAYCDGKLIDRTLQTIFGTRTMDTVQIPLYIVASDTVRAEPFVFSSHATPNVPIWLAVRASLSIPLVLPPVKYEDRMLVDGMLFNNTPFRVFKYPAKHTFGIHLRTHIDRSYKLSSRLHYIKRIFDLAMTGLERMHVELDSVDSGATLYVLDADRYRVLEKYDYDELITFGYDTAAKKIKEHARG